MSVWSKLPSHSQKVLLALIVLGGGIGADCGGPPVVCDPAPPPSVTPARTSAPSPVICDPPPPPSVSPASRTATPSPVICDPPPPPRMTPSPTAKPKGTITPLICDPAPYPPRGDASPTTHSELPLAEIRTVEIAWQGGLTFGAESPWEGARLRWFVSGGEVREQDEQVTWLPPREPGRYLLQVVADWGRAGLAVDSLTLTLDEDGLMSFA